MERLTPGDLMALRDAATALSDIDEDLAMDLHTVGDKMADRLKHELDTPKRVDRTKKDPYDEGYDDGFQDGLDEGKGQ